MHQQQTAFENIVGKGEIARNEQFLLFPQCFLFDQTIVSAFVHISDIISFFAAEFEEPKSGISGKGLTVYQMTKILDLSKFKTVAYDKMNVAEMMISVFDRKHCEKMRKCVLSSGLLKLRIVLLRVCLFGKSMD